MVLPLVSLNPSQLYLGLGKAHMERYKFLNPGLCILAVFIYHT